MPTAEEWKEIAATVKNRFMTKHGDAVRRRGESPRAFVDFLQNEFSLNSAGNVPAEYDRMLNDGFKVNEKIIKNALDVEKLDPNIEVDGLTLFEHFVKNCIPGEHDFKLFNLWTKKKPNTKRPQLVQILVDSLYLDSMPKEELDVDNAEFYMRYMLIKKLWTKLNKDTYFAYDWNKNDYMRALYKEVGKKD